MQGVLAAGVQVGMNAGQLLGVRAPRRHRVGLVGPADRKDGVPELRYGLLLRYTRKDPGGPARHRHGSHAPVDLEGHVALGGRLSRLRGHLAAPGDAPLVGPGQQVRVAARDAQKAVAVVDLVVVR